MVQITVQRQIFEAHNFRGLVLSKNFTETIFVEHGSVPLVSMWYFNISRSLIFKVRCQSVKKSENYAPRKFGAIR